MNYGDLYTFPTKLLVVYQTQIYWLFINLDMFTSYQHILFNLIVTLLPPLPTLQTPFSDLDVVDIIQFSITDFDFFVLHRYILQ